MEDEWQEAGAKPKSQVNIPEATTDTPKASDTTVIPAPTENKRYVAVTQQLEQMHATLLRLETEGKLANTSDLPGLASEYQRKMRLNVNMLYAFMNQYIDVLSDLEKDYSARRQALFIDRLAQPKGTPSAAKTYSEEMTREDAMTIKIVQNRINQIKNDYERYNGICISLQSTMKAENTERIMG